MSLTYEQRYILEELREYLKRVEKMEPLYPFELDDFATEYMETGLPFIGDSEPLNARAAARKELFEKTQRKEKIEIYLRDEE